MSVSSHNDESAKWMGLLPKTETQALEFIQKYPHYDGRGVVVGIFDTGVDPKAIGLNYKTTTGLPKVIDIIDCSGSGDVVMSAEKALNADGTLTGVGNRTIICNPKWKNPTGLYRVGLKRAYDLYPKSLKSRVQEERKKRNDAKLRVTEANLVKELNEVSAKKPVDEAAIEDVKTKLAQFKSCEKEYDDCGPLYDCVVFHDGNAYQAVVDTSETGNMSALESMTDYRVHLQCGQFTDIDALTYCVNIYDGGQVLSICTDAGAHGSHVAGIVAANHPEQPELNGIAPGAQIISFKIGDTRLGSMETGVSLVRGCIEAIKRKVDIVNMSYGEATAVEDKGAFIQLAEQMVHKHGIIFVASAGNNGPALSTNGCPGNSSCAIGVGAYATESLMSVAYSLSDKTLPSTNYTWSSMSPCPDGHFGTAIMAPGGAVTSVPNWTVSRNMLMNGTSMSSPNACGCITLLLSAAKQENMKISPARIKNYIVNSAKFIDHVDILGQGAGLIQVLNAFKLMSYVESSLPSESANDLLDIPYSVKVNSERFSRGIYLRQYNEVSMCNTFSLTVDPIFHDGISIEEKIKFEVRVRLECSAPYVQCPENVYLNSQGKTFNVVVDPRQLGVGVHVTKLKGYDERYKIGPIFEFPITIIKPEVVSEHTTSLAIDTVALEEAQRYRRFVVPPRGCQFIDVVIHDARQSSAAATDDSNDSARNIIFHALQIYKGVPYRDHEKEDAIRLTPGSSHVISFAVDDTRTLELCFARSWNTIGYTAFNAVVHFRGVVPVPSCVTIHGGTKLSEPVRVNAVLHKADVSPSGKLDKWISVVKPVAVGKIFPLGERDVLPDGKILYSLVLEYEVDLADAFEVVCRFPALQGILYESEFHAQFYMIYDAKKMLMGVGDAWPSYVKLGKGKYTVRLQVRHSSIAALEPLNDLPLCFERKLKSSISLSFYRSQSDAVSGNDKIRTIALAVDNSCGIYIKEPTLDQLPKSCSTGDTFIGTMTYLKQNTGELGAGTRPGGYAVKYVYVDTKVKEAKAESGDSAAAATFEDSIRDAKISYLKSQIDNPDTFQPLYSSLVAEYSDNVFIKQVYLSHALKCKASKPSSDTAQLHVIIDAANKIISSIDENEMAVVLGTNADKENAAMMKIFKEVEKKKAVLLEALNAKGKTLLELRQSPLTASDAQNDAAKEFEETYKKICKWDNITNDTYWQVQLGRLKEKRLYGSALKRINELLSSVESGASKVKDGLTRASLQSERNGVMERLGWTEVLEGLLKWQRFYSKDYYEAF